MGLSETARRKRNEKKKKKKKNKNSGSSSAVNAGSASVSQANASSSCASQRRLIGALSFEEQSQLDQSQGDQGPKCAQESEKNQGESLVEYTTHSTHDEEAKKMEQSGLPTAFGTKEKPINFLKECEVESEIPGGKKLRKMLKVTPYLFSRYTKKFAREYMENCGWKEGTGIGKNNDGIIYPLEQTKRKKKDTRGLGSFLSESASDSESENSL